MAVGGHDGPALDIGLALIVGFDSEASSALSDKERQARRAAIITLLSSTRR